MKTKIQLVAEMNDGARASARFDSPAGEVHDLSSRRFFWTRKRPERRAPERHRPVHSWPQLLTFSLLFAFVAPLNQRALAQQFNSGSTGKDGALNVTADTTLNLPPDGILNFTTINVNKDTTLRFNANKFNTPVYLLATGDVTIDGIINVSGGDATRATAGKGGPGGFDGGSPSLGEPLSGDGKGPGGGKGGPPGFGDAGAGAGSYATLPPNPSANDGLTYGSPLLVPLVGGSGGGGTSGIPGQEGPIRRTGQALAKQWQ